jgi:uncharacterized protein YjbI with pentapeptide repeats
MQNIKSIQHLLDAYEKGERHFTELSFENGESFEGLNLSGSTFEKSWFCVYFTNTNLSNCKFIGCNIKTSDFRGADLTNALFTECNVESTRYKGSKMGGFIFENNYFMGSVVGQDFIVEMLEYEEKIEWKFMKSTRNN